MRKVEIRNAYLHNLKNIDVDIPKNKLVAATGVSGSGKSSLIFDILYKEGRNSYLQALGFLEPLSWEKSFESIKGLCPMIAVEQRVVRLSNPRSVVGTKTKLYSYLKLLFGVCGQSRCKVCGMLISPGIVCPQCSNESEGVKTEHFSFNSPEGMCLQCQGRGYMRELDMEKIIPDINMSLPQICMPPWLYSRFEVPLQVFEEAFGIDLKTPYGKLSQEVQQAFLNGFYFSEEKKFIGILPYLKSKLETSNREQYVTELAGKKVQCPGCAGTRLNERIRSILLDGMHIGTLGNMTVLELRYFLEDFRLKNKNLTEYAQSIISSILEQIGHFIDVGLSHLTLFREIPTLSGGEIQRLFLMNHIGSKMSSVIFVFDEPTSGLHELEKDMILEKLEKLQKAGNTVIVIEHDKKTIQKAQHIIDFGPLAGKNGGQVVYQGNYQGLLECKQSITGKYLAGEIKQSFKGFGEIKAYEAVHKLTIENANTNNLKNISVDIPLHSLVGIAGVSGSGKSSLISATLVPILRRYFKQKTEPDGEFASEALPGASVERIYGLEYLKGFVEVSQLQIGRNRNSIPLTYLGVWEKVRQQFANLPEAKRLGLKPVDFSFNSQGACPECGGSGYNQMFLGDMGIVSSRCNKCSGKRYDTSILNVLYNGKSISEILDMNASEAIGFFDDQHINRALETMERIGLGYLLLGQSVGTLSGGEAQRLKLAKEIGSPDKGDMLYILDEPTVGLSHYDVEKLMLIIRELVEQGNSVIIIEHDPAILSCCSHIIELGPGGGHLGGQIIAQGTLTDVKNNKNSLTGPFLEDAG